MDARRHKEPVGVQDEEAFAPFEVDGVRIDQLTEEQRRYLASWDTGT